MSAIFKYFPIKRKSPRIQPLSTFAHTLTESTAQTTCYLNNNNNANTANTSTIHLTTYYNTTTNQSKSFHKTKLIHNKPTHKPCINLIYKRKPSPFLSSTNLSRNIPHTNTHTHIHKHSPSPNKVSFTSNNQLPLNRNGFSHLTKHQLKSTSSLLRQTTHNNTHSIIINKAFIPKPQSKYPIIFNPKAKIPLCDYSDVTKRINKVNKLKMKILTKESQIKFEEPISLVKKHNFSKEFQLLFEHNKPFDFDLQNLKQMNINIHNNILVRHTADKQIKLIHKDERKKRKMYLLYKFKIVIIRAAIKFKQLDININEFYLKYKEGVSAFINEHTKQLITAIRKLKYKEASQLLNDNKYLVLDFDYYKQTPLHWACKRNFYKLIPLIISCGASLNAVDSVGRTPLHLAMDLNCCEAAVVLVMEGASLFKVDLEGKRCGDYCKSELMKFIHKRTLLLHGIHLLGKQKNFYMNVKRGIMYFVINEIKGKVKDDFYEDIKMKLESMMMLYK